MKTKIFTLSILAIFQFGILGGIVSADETANQNQNQWAPETIKVLVTEKVPWANCACAIPIWEKEDKTQEGIVDGFRKAGPLECKLDEVTKRPPAYICEHKAGLAGFQELFAKTVRWVIMICLLLGVLAIAALGVAWAMAGAEDSETKKFLKNWIINLIVGLIILFLFQPILKFLAPWVYQ